jgi:hypothetical protein
MLRPARLLPPKRLSTPRSARPLSKTNRGLLPGAAAPTRTGLPPASSMQLPGRTKGRSLWGVQSARYRGIGVRGRRQHGGADGAGRYDNRGERPAAGVGRGLRRRRTRGARRPHGRRHRRSPRHVPHQPRLHGHGEAFSALGGRYARVFVGVAPGWLAADAHGVTAEDIAAHCDAIRNLDGFTLPSTLHEEVRTVAATVAGRHPRSMSDPRILDSRPTGTIPWKTEEP